jgi:hypothetical protein
MNNYGLHVKYHLLIRTFNYTLVKNGFSARRWEKQIPLSKSPWPVPFRNILLEPRTIGWGLICNFTNQIILFECGTLCLDLGCQLFDRLKSFPVVLCILRFLNGLFRLATTLPCLVKVVWIAERKASECIETGFGTRCKGGLSKSNASLDGYNTVETTLLWISDGLGYKGRSTWYSTTHLCPDCSSLHLVYLWTWCRVAQSLQTCIKFSWKNAIPNAMSACAFYEKRVWFPYSGTLFHAVYEREITFLPALLLVYISRVLKFYSNIHEIEKCAVYLGLCVRRFVARSVISNITSVPRRKGVGQNDKIAMLYCLQYCEEKWRNYADRL